MKGVNIGLYTLALVLLATCHSGTSQRHCPRYCPDTRPGGGGWGYGCGGYGTWGNWGWGHWNWGHGSWGYGYCGPVCATDANGNMKEFANMCQLYRQNCLNPSNRYNNFYNDVCTPKSTSQTTKQPTTTMKPVTTTQSATSMQPTTTMNPVTTTQSATSMQPTTPTIIPANDVSKHPMVGLINSGNCGMVAIDPRIFNGNPAKLFQYPWMALVVVTWGNDSYASCGGSVINDRYVLTAGHCVINDKGLKVKTAYAILGVHDVATDTSCLPGTPRCDNPPDVFGVSAVLPHPGYGKKPGYGDDIALLRLSTVAKFTVAVKPICLPVGLSEQARMFDGEMLTVAGWGLTSPNTSTTVLMTADVPGFPSANCTRALNGFQEQLPASERLPINITEGQMCAGGKNKDACQGDSGGPLFYPELGMTNRVVQYGLVSFGPACVNASLPGVYTRVGFYMKWILDNIYV